MKLFGTLLPDRQRLAGFFREAAAGKGGPLFYLALAGLIIGGTGMACIFVLGHGRTTNTSSLVPWGLQISTYVFFALVSGGCIFTNFLGHKFFHHTYQPLAGRVIFLGLTTAIAGFASLASELGHVERMYLFLLSPNPTSPMFWMSVWYTADIAILLAEYVNIQRRRHSQPLLYASFIIPVITYCSLGSLFGAVGSLPYYYSALLPVYFLFAGFLSGNALCAILAALRARATGDTALLRPFRRMQKIALASLFVLTFCRIVIGLGSSLSGHEVFRETLGQNLFLGLGLGLAVPFMILTWQRGPASLVLSSLIVLATQFMARVELVTGGFRVPVFRVYAMPERISYHPSIFELLVVVASVAVVVLLYLIAERTGLFPATEGETHR